MTSYAEDGHVDKVLKPKVLKDRHRERMPEKRGRDMLAGDRSKNGTGYCDKGKITKEVRQGTGGGIIQNTGTLKTCSGKRDG